MSEELDYQKYTFRADQKLEITPNQLRLLQNFADAVFQDGVQTHFEPKFDFIHKTKGTTAPKNTKKATLDKDYQKVLSYERTIQGKPVEKLSSIAAYAMEVQLALKTVHMENVDAGNGVLIEDLKKELAEANLQKA